MGSASIRRTCALSVPGSLSLFCSASVEQLVVGDAAPEEEREARRELDVADRVRRSARGAFGLGFDPERERGARQNAAQRELDAGFEAAVRAPLLEKRHEPVDVAVHRAAIGAPSERGQNLARARGSSSTPAGEQVKMRRRLGVSPGPVAV